LLMRTVAGDQLKNTPNSSELSKQLNNLLPTNTQPSIATANITKPAVPQPELVRADASVQAEILFLLGQLRQKDRSYNRCEVYEIHL